MSNNVATVCHSMRERVIRFRANDEDVKILEAVIRKLGMDGSHVLRLALRKLAESEGVLKNK